MSDGAVKTWPLLLLRLEGACIFTSSIWAYSRLSNGPSWWTFAALLLAPDVGMAGYFTNTEVGAACYNVLHTETPAIMLLCAAWATGRGGDVGKGVGLCWLAHIGIDRMFGFGLKYGTGFKRTHLGDL